MKHIKRIYCFLFLFPCAASGMSQDCIELLPLISKITTTPAPQHAHAHEIIHILDKAIEKKYPQTNPFIDYFYNLFWNQKELLTIVSIPSDVCKNEELLTFSVLECLRQKNCFFKRAIDYFLTFAHKNIDNVNHKTLDIVSNPNCDQPVAELNLLPSFIKKYVMFLARNEIKLTYEIKLEHCDQVLSFDICPLTQKIVTHSKDRKVRLWDLDTGEYVNTFPETNYVNTLKFNGDGSLLVTTAYFNDTNESFIRIWEPNNQEMLSVIQLPHYVYHLDFTQDQLHKTLTAFIYKEKTEQKILGLWNIEDANHPAFLGFSSPLPWKGETLIDVHAPYKHYYNSHFHDHDRSTLYVEKKHCDDLHLCQQAIENCTMADALPNISNSSPFKNLTKYEERMVGKAIITKMAQLFEK